MTPADGGLYLHHSILFLLRICANCEQVFNVWGFWSSFAHLVLPTGLLSSFQLDFILYISFRTQFYNSLIQFPRTSVSTWQLIILWLLEVNITLWSVHIPASTPFQAFVPLGTEFLSTFIARHTSPALSGQPSIYTIPTNPAFQVRVFASLGYHR